MIIQEDVPYTKEEVKAMVKTIHDLRKKVSQLGWHPASELPPVNEETGLSDEVIAIQDRFCEGERVIYTRIVGSGWKHDNVKWWCYPPQND